MLLVHTNYIIAIAFEALTDDQFKNNNPYYVVSDIRSYAEVASIIGKAIGKEVKPWIPFTDEDFRNGAKGAGLFDLLADIFVQVGEGLASGTLADHYESFATPPPRGGTKLETYAKEFALVYKQA